MKLEGVEIIEIVGTVEVSSRDSSRRGYRSDSDLSSEVDRYRSRSRDESRSRSRSRGRSGKSCTY